MTWYQVVVRRENGRLLKEFPATSKYAAKKQRAKLEKLYDETYSVTVEPTERR
jgi:hypothetical protein